MKYENYETVQNICQAIKRYEKCLERYDGMGRKNLSISSGHNNVIDVFLYDGSEALSGIAEEVVILFIKRVKEKIEFLKTELELL